MMVMVSREFVAQSTFDALRETPSNFEISPCPTKRALKFIHIDVLLINRRTTPMDVPQIATRDNYQITQASRILPLQLSVKHGTRAHYFEK